MEIGDVNGTARKDAEEPREDEIRLCWWWFLRGTRNIREPERENQNKETQKRMF
jgi:hypothetical protein